MKVYFARRTVDGDRESFFVYMTVRINTRTFYSSTVYQTEALKVTREEHMDALVKHINELEEKEELFEKELSDYPCSPWETYSEEI